MPLERASRRFFAKGYHVQQSKRNDGTRWKYERVYVWQINRNLVRI